MLYDRSRRVGDSQIVSNGTPGTALKPTPAGADEGGRRHVAEGLLNDPALFEDASVPMNGKPYGRSLALEYLAWSTSTEPGGLSIHSVPL